MNRRKIAALEWFLSCFALICLPFISGCEGFRLYKDLRLERTEGYIMDSAGRIHRVQVLPIGKRIASPARRAFTLFIIDSRSKLIQLQQYPEWGKTLELPVEQDTWICGAYNLDSNRVVLGVNKQSQRNRGRPRTMIWDLRNGSHSTFPLPMPLDRFLFPKDAPAVHPTLSHLIYPGGYRRGMLVVDLEQGAQKWIHDGQSVNCVRYSPDGTCFAFAIDSEVFVQNHGSDEVRRIFPPLNINLNDPSTNNRFKNERIELLSWSPSGKYLAAVSWRIGGGIKVWCSDAGWGIKYHRRSWSIPNPPLWSLDESRLIMFAEKGDVRPAIIHSKVEIPIHQMKDRGYWEN